MLAACLLAGPALAQVPPGARLDQTGAPGPNVAALEYSRPRQVISPIIHPDHTVTITWSDGARGVVDFLPIIDRGGWFTPLRDGDYFAATMIVLEGGTGLTWPEEIDYASDALRRDAFPHGMPE